MHTITTPTHHDPPFAVVGAAGVAAVAILTIGAVMMGQQAREVQAPSDGPQQSLTTRADHQVRTTTGGQVLIGP